MLLNIQKLKKNTVCCVHAQAHINLSPDYINFGAIPGKAAIITQSYNTTVQVTI